MLFLSLFLLTTVNTKPIFRIKSPDINNKQSIPSKYTCNGKDISPEIHFKNIPKGTKSIAIIMDDPDAPMGIWVHWVIYNIPPDTFLIENFPPKMKVGKTCQGKNSWGRYGYGGPCPPSGTHRYFFKAFALDTVFECKKDLPKKKLLQIIHGHVLARDTLMGTYKHQKKE